MISRLLAWLLLLACPAAQPGEPDPSLGAEPAPDPSAADEPEFTDTPADPDPDPSADDPAARYAAELETERRARTAEKERADRYEREMAELRARSASPHTDSQFEQEERILRDPNSTEQQKWTVNANREIRSANALARNSMIAAADVNDRTAWAAVKMGDSLAARYEARVEEVLQKERAAGRSPTREAIYTFLLGQDMRQGKYKKKPAAAIAAKPNAQVRGRTPGVRSDVASSANLNDREKRRQRLENQPI